MNQIFLDTAIPPFVPAKAINLGTLKKDIDRRFNKIRSLIGLSQINYTNITNKQLVSTASQTGQKQQNQSHTQRGKHRRAFSEQENISAKQGAKNDNYRGSLACTRNKKKDQGEGANDCNVRIRVSDYLSSQKKQICKKNCLREVEALGGESEDENEKTNFQNSQDDKIFKSIEFQLHSSFKSMGHAHHGEGPLCTYIISESVSGEPSQSESTISQQQEQRRSFSAINQKQASMKKIKYTDRTSVPQVKRIVVSEDCVLKISELINNQVSKNRKQPSDSKLRSNLIKKIEQKYGEYYENN